MYVFSHQCIVDKICAKDTLETLYFLLEHFETLEPRLEMIFHGVAIAYMQPLHIIIFLDVTYFGHHI